MRGFDRNDVELMRSAFWPDAQINYRDQVNTFDEFVQRHLVPHTEQLNAWGHLLTNETVEVLGDVAHCETYVTALFVLRPGAKWYEFRRDERLPLIIAGRYVDRLDRRDGDWRISVREFVGHFASLPEALHGTLEPSQLAHAWDRSDVSYRRPLLPRETPTSSERS
jgi:hypothetical protein